MFLLICSRITCDVSFSGFGSWTVSSSSMFFPICASIESNDRFFLDESGLNLFPYIFSKFNYIAILSTFLDEIITSMISSPRIPMHSRVVLGVMLFSMFAIEIAIPSSPRAASVYSRCYSKIYHFWDNLPLPPYVVRTFFAVDSASSVNPILLSGVVYIQKKQNCIYDQLKLPL